MVEASRISNWDVTSLGLPLRSFLELLMCSC